VSCPGLHCPGCSEGQTAGILGGLVIGAVVAYEVSAWVAEHIWEIGAVLAVCFALSVTASMALEAWADRRGARFAAAHGILSRTDVILPEPVRAVVVEPKPERAAIAPAPQVVVNIFGVPSPGQAEVIRQAIERR